MAEQGATIAQQKKVIAGMEEILPLRASAEQGKEQSHAGHNPKVGAGDEHGEQHGVDPRRAEMAGMLELRTKVRGVIDYKTSMIAV